MGAVRARNVVSAPAHALKDLLSPVMPEAEGIFDKIRKEIDRKGIYHPPVYAVGRVPEERLQGRGARERLRGAARLPGSEA